MKRCEYCKGYGTLQDSNHKIGCNLEGIAQTLRFRSYDREADILDEVASRLK